MKKMGVISLLVVALICVLVFVAQALFLDKRPTILGTHVGDSPLHPTTFRLVINGRQVATRRSKGLNDGGGLPYKNMFQRTMEVEMMWIELFTKKAYGVNVTVPVKQLSRYDAARRHANFEVQIGPNGALSIETAHPQQLQLLRERKDDQITPEMGLPVVLVQTCATELAKTDPRSIEMAEWADDEHVLTREGAKREEFIANNPDYHVADPCG